MRWIPVEYLSWSECHWRSSKIWEVKADGLVKLSKQISQTSGGDIVLHSTALRAKEEFTKCCHRVPSPFVNQLKN